MASERIESAIEAKLLRAVGEDLTEDQVTQLERQVEMIRRLAE